MTMKPTLRRSLFYLVVSSVIATIVNLWKGPCALYGVYSLPVVFVLTGILASLVRRLRAHRLAGDKRLLDIILSDFRFTNYATPSILSIVYAVIQGAGFGAALGFLILIPYKNACFPGGLLGYLPDDFLGIASMSFQHMLALSGLSALGVILSRLFLEAYVLIYRVATDIAHYTRRDE